MDDVIELTDGRTVGFATFGSPDGVPVIWCHGGPGSRLDPVHRDLEAARAGLLLVGIDRPGYGVSTPLPGRTIADWIPDAMAVADELGLESSWRSASPRVVPTGWRSLHSFLTVCWGPSHAVP